MTRPANSAQADNFLKDNAMADETPLPLDISSVAVRFGDHQALTQLDLTLRAGEVYALLGPNGAGKTTTINLILGFQSAAAGRVIVSGVDVSSDPIEARKTIAYIPEQVALYPHLSGVDNLRYFAALADLRLDQTALRELLQNAGLDPAAHDRKCGGYSKGMRQKVGIAVAIARNSRLLLLDEPTSGLDPSAAADFSKVVRLAAERGTAVLMATHDLYRVREVADRVGILSGGRISRELDPKTLDHIELERIYIEELAV